MTEEQFAQFVQDSGLTPEEKKRVLSPEHIADRQRIFKMLNERKNSPKQDIKTECNHPCASNTRDAESGTKNERIPVKASFAIMASDWMSRWIYDTEKKCEMKSSQKRDAISPPSTGTSTKPQKCNFAFFAVIFLFVVMVVSYMYWSNSGVRTTIHMNQVNIATETDNKPTADELNLVTAGGLLVDEMRNKWELDLYPKLGGDLFNPELNSRCRDLSSYKSLIIDYMNNPNSHVEGPNGEKMQCDPEKRVLFYRYADGVVIKDLNAEEYVFRAKQITSPDMESARRAFFQCARNIIDEHKRLCPDDLEEKKMKIKNTPIQVLVPDFQLYACAEYIAEHMEWDYCPVHSTTYENPYIIERFDEMRRIAYSQLPKDHFTKIEQCKKIMKQSFKKSWTKFEMFHRVKVMNTKWWKWVSELITPQPRRKCSYAQ